MFMAIFDITEILEHHLTSNLQEFFINFKVW